MLTQRKRRMKTHKFRHQVHFWASEDTFVKKRVTSASGSRIARSLPAWLVLFSPWESMCVSSWQNVVLETSAVAGTTTVVVLSTLAGVSLCLYVDRYLSPWWRHNWARYGHETLQVCWHQTEGQVWGWVWSDLERQLVDGRWGCCDPSPDGL